MRTPLQTLRTIAILPLVLALAPGARAAALPVSVPITLDGDVSDWGPALINPANTSQDGDGSTVACSYSTDRDCDTQGNQHDLRRFAWTWDSTNLYFYIQRYGNGAPWAHFEIYLDQNRNGRMQTGEAVLLIRWNDVGTSFYSELDTYREAVAGGDTIIDAQSRTDGYDLPGSLQAGSMVTSVALVPGGLELEGALTWSDIGVAANSPMYFHVSSSDSANIPASLRDNMGGAGGGIGDTGYRSVSLVSSQDLSAAPGSTVRLSHRACNLGNIPARLNVLGISSTGYDIKYWRDSNADGWPDIYLALDAGGDGSYGRSQDDLRPEGDGDGDGKLDLGVVGAGVCQTFIVEQTYPTNSAGVLESVTLRVSQQAAPAVLAEVADTVRIGKITLRANQDAFGAPGGLGWFPHVVQNNTTTSERIDLTVTSTLGWTYALYFDPNGDGDPSDASLLTDSDLTGAPDVQATAGESVHVFARASIPPSTALGVVETATVNAVVRGNVRDQVTDTLQTRLALEVMPDHTLASNDERYGAPGESIYFPHRIVNSQGARDTFDLSTTSSAGWPVTILTDPNADGRPYDSTVIASMTPAIAANGGSLPVIVRLDIPSGAVVGSSTDVTFTATSRTTGSVTDFALDQGFAAIVRAYEDPAHLLNVQQAEGCSTVYVRAGGLPPSVPDHRFVWRDALGAGMRVTLVSTDASGSCVDQLTLTSSETGPGWSVDIQSLQSGNWVTLDTATFDITDSVALRSASMSRLSYTAVGATVAGHAVLENTSTSAPRDIALRWVVRSPDGTQYLRPNGSFGSYTGSESTATDSFTLGTLASAVRPWAVASVTFPVEGTYSVELWRVSACGAAYLATTTSFLVADDPDQDGLRSADEVAAGTDTQDADSDDDGLPDGQDGLTDSDGDTLIDALDCDSDNDLLLDGTEAGVWDAPAATDDGAGCFVADQQPSTTTDPKDADTDDGGVPDGIEDADRDGRRDVGETNPLDPADDVTSDTDGDGLLDVAEIVLGTGLTDADSDDDGVSDGAEAYFDADGDGLDDALECDSDADGLPDGLERGVTAPLAATRVDAGCFRADANPATTTDPRVADTDAGGVNDGAEDANRDGAIGPFETDPNDPSDDDSDGDNLPNVQEAALGTDPFDRDTDDDGVIDAAETADSDSDSVADALECDTDGDTLPDGLERGLIAPDSGTDLGAGCFRADSDPMTTTDPSRSDTDAGGVPDGAEDVNRNGRIDAGETDPASAFDDDSDGDGLSNLAEEMAGTSRFDRDSDDDGVIDGLEFADADGDLVSDALECDTDGDMLPDGLERGVTTPDAGTDVAAGCFRADADPSSTTDPASADTDSGSVMDGVEDSNGNGAVDAGETDPNDGRDDSTTPDGDQDGDGLTNSQEAALGTNPADGDTDDDGLIDSAEAFDADGDREADALECDTDADTLPDGLERGVTAPLADTNLASLCFRADADPSTTTNPASADTDGGGMPDGIEDADGDGAIGARERSPLDPTDDACSVASPAELTGLRVGHAGIVAHLSWDPVADACTTYTAWTSQSLPALTVLAAGLSAATVDDPAAVGAGGVTFYLVSAESRIGGAGPTGLQ